MKKTKENVYVVINTPKKAKKVKKVLDMFGEKIERYTNETLSDYNQPWTTDGEGVPALFYSNRSGFIGEHAHSIKDKERVSIKELRNLLAFDHLKEGDVVVTKVGNEKIIAIYDHACKSNLALFQAKRWVRVSDGFKWNNEGCFDTFLRYATEEEKALLEFKRKELTKSEVEKKVIEYAVSVNWEYESLNNYIGNRISQEEYDILDCKYTDDKVKFIIENFKPKSIKADKWYKGNGDKLIFTTSDEQGGYVKAYGFGAMGGWFEDDHDFTWTTDDLKEATKEEVEQALIKEAKRRYKVGDKVRSLVAHSPEFNISEHKYMQFSEINDLWGRCGDANALVFRDGKWAEIVEPCFVESSDKIKVAGENIGKRVRVIDGGNGATGCNGQTGIIVDKPKKHRNGSLHPVIYVKLDNGHTWGLAMDHKIEYLTESSPLTVTLEIKDIATLQVIQKTLKELEEN